GSPIADQVGEVDHLGGDGIVDREITPREQTAEVQALRH
ncbi:MAG: hypothetical protein QOD72_1767, partial [Acidimicrobiaceae bacterium]|nr:hypothetical protein [Acidimicrobiaceae bacterium]